MPSLSIRRATQQTTLHLERRKSRRSCQTRRLNANNTMVTTGQYFRGLCVGFFFVFLTDVIFFFLKKPRRPSEIRLLFESCYNCIDRDGKRRCDVLLMPARKCPGGFVVTFLFKDFPRRWPWPHCHVVADIMGAHTRACALTNIIMPTSESRRF